MRSSDARDTPRGQDSPKDQARKAGHGEDPTLGTYLSSLVYLFSFPALVLLAYGGYWAGYYSYKSIIPVFGGLLLAVVVAVFAVMHFATAR